MNPRLLVMLTWHDVTVPNAKQIFLEAKDAPANDWGFKIEGTTKESMTDLIKTMKDAGKTVYIEVLAIDEPTCLDAAKLCVNCGVDHVLGTVYYESVHNVLKEAGISYSPFIGLNEETRLRGTVESIIEKAKDAESKGVSGISLSAFRYLDGDPNDLLTRLAPELTKPFVVAGSVAGKERIDFLKTLPNLYGFTIGGAFFEKKFGDTFSEQIKVVTDYLR